MTVQLAGAVQLALRRWGPALLLAALLATACAEEKPYFGQEVRLKLADPNLQYKIVDGAMMEHEVASGSTEVLVRVSGGMATEIVVRVYNGGALCAEVRVPVTGKPPYEVNVKCTFDSGVPPATPDAEVLPPDTGPDLSPDTGPSPSCLSYCAVMADRCPGVYKAQRECLETCAAHGWIPGARNVAENSVECRIGQAMRATTPDELPYCYAAGPTGGQVCGTLCYNLCDTAARNCRGLLIGGDVQVCKRECKEPPQTRALRSDRGNTLECRIFWMGEAGKDDGASCARLAEGSTTSPCQD